MAVVELHTEVLHSGLGYPEAPRWHEGSLWLSDFHTRLVSTVGLDGSGADVVAVPGVPSGLGFVAAGPIVVSMSDAKVYNIIDNQLVEYADLSEIATGPLNDLVVDAAGRAYVGNFGYDLVGGESPRTAKLAMIDTDGSVRVAADELVFPNGAAVSADGGTLFVAETFAARVTAFVRHSDGTLGERRVFAELPGCSPDGICVDDEGALWVASPYTFEFLRVTDGGQVVARIPTGERWAVACALGGHDGRTFFGLTADTDFERFSAGVSSGFVEVTTVDVPAAQPA